jgi:tRNA A37 threonylcarbamoyltransferase TsaD
VLRHVRARQSETGAAPPTGVQQPPSQRFGEPRRSAPVERASGDGAFSLALSDLEIADIAASFQRVVVTALIDRLFVAARRYDAKSVGVSGGVSANSRLRAELQARGERREVPTFLPSLALSTDNAAMIAAAGLRKFRAGITASLDLNADAALPLACLL